MKKILGLVVVVVLAIVAVPPAHAAGRRYGQQINVPVTLQAIVEAMDCSNHQGAYVNFGGSYEVGSINAHVHFKSGKTSVLGSGDSEFVENVEVVPATSGSFNKQPSLGGVGGNPYIWVQINNDAWIYAGRCVQGFRMVIDRTYQVPSTVSTFNKSMTCSNTESSMVIDDAQVTSGSIPMQVMLDSQWTGQMRPSTKAAGVTVTINGSGSFTSGHRPRGMGGNPDILLGFGTNSAGSLGKCKALL